MRVNVVGHGVSPACAAGSDDCIVHLWSVVPICPWQELVVVGDDGSNELGSAREASVCSTSGVAPCR